MQKSTSLVLRSRQYCPEIAVNLWRRGINKWELHSWSTMEPHIDKALVYRGFYSLHSNYCDNDVNTNTLSIYV